MFVCHLNFKILHDFSYTGAPCLFLIFYMVKIFQTSYIVDFPQSFEYEVLMYAFCIKL
jgi:hypothetical protein